MKCNSRDRDDSCSDSDNNENDNNENDNNENDNNNSELFRKLEILRRLDEARAMYKGNIDFGQNKLSISTPLGELENAYICAKEQANIYKKMRMTNYIKQIKKLLRE